jgi:hypothetical protein
MIELIVLECLQNLPADFGLCRNRSQLLATAQAFRA